MSENNTINFSEENIQCDNRLFKTINSLKSLIGTNTILKGYVFKCNRDGDLYIQYNDITCIMPRNNITSVVAEGGNVHKSVCESKVGKDILFNIEEIKDNTIYVTRLNIINDLRRKYSEELQIGSVVSGKITNIEERIGAFVDVGADFIAMLPKKDMEYFFIDKITDYFNIGDEVKGVVTDLIKDKKTGIIKEIVINRVKTLPPFSDLIRNFEDGDVILATITGIHSTGITAQISNNLGLTCYFNPNIKNLSVGQKIKVKIKLKIAKARINGSILGLA